MSVEDKYKLVSDVEAITTKDWAAGSANPISSFEPVLTNADSENKPVWRDITYPPAWWKMVDEPIVNTLDQIMRILLEAYKASDFIDLGKKILSENPPLKRGMLDNISVSFEDGVITVRNNGEGIEVEEHKEASKVYGKTIYVPELIFGYVNQGSNTGKRNNSIIGGTNGIGAKISNFFSEWFEIQTFDGTKHYEQRWEQGIASPPKIKSLKRKDKFVMLRFKPDYSKFEDYYDEKTYNDLIYTRAVFANVYAFEIYKRIYKQSYKSIVRYNDEIIAIKTTEDLTKALYSADSCISGFYSADIESADNPYKWEISVVKSSLTDKSHNMSMVNGIVVSNGSHIKTIEDELYTQMKPKIEKRLNAIDPDYQNRASLWSKQKIMGLVRFFVNAKVIDPSWTGQRKDVLATDRRKFKAFAFNKGFVDKVADKIVIPSLLVEYRKLLAIKELASTNNRKSKANEIIVPTDIYIPANRLKTGNCKLILAEGHSAMGTVKTGLATLGDRADYYGIMSMGGVIINAQKEHKSDMEINGDIRPLQSLKFKDNKFVSALKNAVGLEEVYKYEKTPEGNKQFNMLKYKGIVVCVDQDLDGMGQILGLVLNMFHHIWPALIERGYIQWYATPIIRAYPKRGTKNSKNFAFYSARDYKKWESTLNDDVNKYYDVSYYKGLGSHDTLETEIMFKNFEKSLYTFTLDPGEALYHVDEKHRASYKTVAKRMFHIYYGIEPAERKRELASSMRYRDDELDEKQKTTYQISCNDHLMYETFAFQKDSIERHLDHVIDGQNQAGRKILHGIIRRMSNGRHKIVQIGGMIMANENYHHGEASLSNSLTARGFITVGGVQLPFIVPHGNFGSRAHGGKDHAQPRYIEATANKRLTNLLFPEQDYELLPFEFDEGKRAEPSYFVPVLPLNILESASLPAHGWALTKYARDVFDVIETVKTDIISIMPSITELSVPCKYTKYRDMGYKGEIKVSGGKEYSLGAYEATMQRDECVITITELPLRTWTNPWLMALYRKLGIEYDITNKTKKAVSKASMDTGSKNPYVKNIIDKSGKHKVEIIIVLKPGAYEEIMRLGHSRFGFALDGIMVYFNLYKALNKNLNFIMPDHSVKTFEKYIEAYKVWFAERKSLYKYRIARELILLILKYILEVNIITYIELSNDMQLSKQDEAEMVRILKDRGFSELWHTRINKPDFMPTEELVYTIAGQEGVNKASEIIEKVFNGRNKNNRRLRELKAVLTVFEKGRYEDKRSYDYLLNISDIKKSRESLKKHIIAKDTIIAQIEELVNDACSGNFIGANIWLKEIVELEKLIEYGMSTVWKYEDIAKYDAKNCVEIK